MMQTNYNVNNNLIQGTPSETDSFTLSYFEIGMKKTECFNPIIIIYRSKWAIPNEKQFVKASSNPKAMSIVQLVKVTFFIL